MDGEEVAPTTMTATTADEPKNAVSHWPAATTTQSSISTTTTSTANSSCSSSSSAGGSPVENSDDGRDGRDGREGSASPPCSLLPSRSEIYVHRGAGVSASGGDSLIPENSMEAFEHAVAGGLVAVELDVWMTADRQVVVIHGAGSDREGWLHDTVVCEDEKTGRIEELHYTESRRKGELSHRRTWTTFVEAAAAPAAAAPAASDSKAAATESKAAAAPAATESKAASNFGAANETTDPNDPASSSSTTESTTTESTTTGSTCSSSQDGNSRTDRMTETTGEKEKISSVIVPPTETSYRRDLCRHSGGSSAVPLLEEVLQRFHGRLRFNVELKGTEPLLSAAVVQLARKFPGSVARISSFAWKVPRDLLSWAERAYADLLRSADCGKVVRHPNGCMAADLLGDETLRTSGIPLALLFEGPEIPPLALMRKCAESYGSTWVHLPYSVKLSACDVEDENDLENEAAAWLEADEDLRRLLEAFPEEKPSQHLPARRAALVESAALRRITRYLARYGIKVLVYGGRAHEREERLALVLKCGVAGLCPNDGLLALKLLQRRAGLQN